MIENCVYALELFCVEVFKKYPDRKILPGLITQSPLEMLFGVLKQGSQLLTYEGYHSGLKKMRANWSARNTTSRGTGNDAKFTGPGLV